MKKRLDKLKQRFRNIKPRYLIVQLIITLFYPISKTAISEYNRLLIFTDTLTIIAALLLIAGIVYSLFLHGDFDISAFLLGRGLRRDHGPRQSFSEYLAEKREEREDSFNYPLFLGLVYLAVAVILAYVFV